MMDLYGEYRPAIEAAIQPGFKSNNAMVEIKL